MIAAALAIGILEVVLGTAAGVMHLRNPYTGAALLALRIGGALLALSLLSFAGAVLVAVPESRGVLAVVVLVVVGGLAVAALRQRGPRIGPLHAETEAAQAQPARQTAQPDISSYTVRTRPQAAHGGVRSARVRRIQGMEGSYGN